MTEEFNKWWDSDLLLEKNPYVDGTPAYWAWEGWCAGVKAEREECAKVVDAAKAGEEDWDSNDWNQAVEFCVSRIRARGNT